MSDSFPIFEDDVLAYIQNSYIKDKDKTACGQDGDLNCQERFQRLLAVLRTPPIFSTLRMNTRLKSPEEVCWVMQDYFGQKFNVEKHKVIPDALIIKGSGPHTVPQLNDKVIVDLSCGMAVLRGAHVFAKGVMAAPSYMQPGDKVSVYADVKGKCTKGLTKPFEEGPAHFVGNGIARISRQDLFGSNATLSGVAVEMDSAIYHCPSLSEVPADLVFPQNLPSIVCGHVLDPQPGENVLDMCAAPGGKTTHLACLMQNKGQVVAFDKSQQKVDKILKAAENWGLTNIKAYVFDGTKAVGENQEANEGPPFNPETFDRVLLDAPCSALGQRPNVYCRDKLRQVQSPPKLQKKLFTKAVELLKIGGTLVYSTCTFTTEENEDVVAWALSTFPSLKLVPQVPHIGGPGLPGTLLTEEQSSLVQRFDPSAHPDYQLSADTDTIGFFCSKFIKS